MAICQRTRIFAAFYALALNATCQLLADDRITFSDGSQPKADIFGFRDGNFKVGIQMEVQSIPPRDVHSIMFDRLKDSMAFVMKNGCITEGDVVEIEGTKAKLSDGREIALNGVREMFRIAKMATANHGVGDEVRIGEWFVKDKERRSYAIIIEKVGGDSRMLRVSRSHVEKPVALVEIEDGVCFSIEGDPKDKYMRINKDGNLELWLAKRKLGTLRRFGMKE